MQYWFPHNVNCLQNIKKFGDGGCHACVEMAWNYSLLNLRSLGYTWKEISSLLILSCSTLWRRVAELGIREQTRYSNISDEELDQVIRSFIATHGSHIGFSMVYGHLHSTGLKVQRDGIRTGLKRVDPNNSHLRRAAVITRQTYSVPGPNRLWHIDGHHSLTNWGFVIHGGIDCFSHLTFLKLLYQQ